MSEFFEVLAWRKNRDGKSVPIRCGYAKPREDGGFQVYLDAMPAPENGQWSLTVARKRERPDARPSDGGGGSVGLNDEMPF